MILANCVVAHATVYSVRCDFVAFWPFRRNYPITTPAYPTALSGLCGAIFASVSKLF